MNVQNPQAERPVSLPPKTGGLNGLRLLLDLLTPRERRRGMLLLLLAIGMAFVDTLGVASVMPFLAVLGAPQMVESNPVLAWAYREGGFTTPQDFLFALGFFALVAVVSASLFRALAQYAIQRFVNMRRYSISARLFESYLSRSYAFFLDRNSADLVKRTMSDIDMVVDQCLQPVVQMVAYGAVIVCIVALIVVVNPTMALVLLGSVGGAYGLIYLFSRWIVRHVARDRDFANRNRFTVAGEGIGGIKEVKLMGRERAYAERFRRHALDFARYKAVSDTVALVPRYLIESVGIAVIILLALWLMKLHGDLGGVLPVLGLYAFAGFKLLPAMQNVYMGLVRLNFYLPNVIAITEDLDRNLVQGALPGDAAPLAFSSRIRFERVSFRYGPGQRWILRELDLDIPANTTTGFVGETGSGKTTAIDLMLGLLAPTEGQILIDGEPLTEANRRAWQANLAYVPQSIFLADASVAENIAFGIPKDRIDMVAVERAARLARIHDFVQRDLPKGYDTEVGERGVRLSGGQRQRIGIARALYGDPKVLVFDEATSALDSATETALMEAIDTLQHQKTMVMIAHRLTSLRNADRIVEFSRVQAAEEEGGPSTVREKA